MVAEPQVADEEEIAQPKQEQQDHLRGIHDAYDDFRDIDRFANKGRAGKAIDDKVGALKDQHLGKEGNSTRDLFDRLTGSGGRKSGAANPLDNDYWVKNHSFNPNAAKNGKDAVDGGKEAIEGGKDMAENAADLGEGAANAAGAAEAVAPEVVAGATETGIAAAGAGATAAAAGGGAAAGAGAGAGAGAEIGAGVGLAGLAAGGVGVVATEPIAAAAGAEIGGTAGAVTGGISAGTTAAGATAAAETGVAAGESAEKAANTAEKAAKQTTKLGKSLQKIGDKIEKLTDYHHYYEKIRDRAKKYSKCGFCCMLPTLIFIFLFVFPSMVGAKILHFDVLSSVGKAIVSIFSHKTSTGDISFTNPQSSDAIQNGQVGGSVIHIFTQLPNGKKPTFNFAGNPSPVTGLNNQPYEFDVITYDTIDCNFSGQKLDPIKISLAANFDWRSAIAPGKENALCAVGYYPGIDSPTASSFGYLGPNTTFNLGDLVTAGPLCARQASAEAIDDIVQKNAQLVADKNTNDIPLKQLILPDEIYSMISQTVNSSLQKAYPSKAPSEIIKTRAQAGGIHFAFD